MGREIRRVPPNWEHPVYSKENSPRQEWIGEYRPCEDKDYKTATANWKREFAEWEVNGPIRQNHDGTLREYEYWEYAGTPDPDTCRPEFTEEPTWWQVYQTVSEGTPVSPPFATPEELVDYLTKNGDFWDQERGRPPPSRAACEAFIKEGWTPSMVVTDGVMKEGIRSAGE